MLSDAVPLITEVSAAMELVSTLTPFKGKSNHPIFFDKILLYRSLLIAKVTFSLKVEKLIFDRNWQVQVYKARQAKKTHHISVT